MGADHDDFYAQDTIAVVLNNDGYEIMPSKLALSLYLSLSLTEINDSGEAVAIYEPAAKAFGINLYLTLKDFLSSFSLPVHI